MPTRRHTGCRLVAVIVYLRTSWGTTEEDPADPDRLGNEGGHGTHRSNGPHLTFGKVVLAARCDRPGRVKYQQEQDRHRAQPSAAAHRTNNDREDEQAARERHVGEGVEPRSVHRYLNGSWSAPRALYQADRPANSFRARSAGFLTTTGRGATSAARSFTSNRSSRPKQNSSGEWSSVLFCSINSFRLPSGAITSTRPIVLSSSAAAARAITLDRGPSATTVTGLPPPAQRETLSSSLAWRPSARSPTVASRSAHR